MRRWMKISIQSDDHDNISDDDDDDVDENSSLNTLKIKILCYFFHQISSHLFSRAKKRQQIGEYLTTQMK